jgi:hypothetical protein
MYETHLDIMKAWPGGVSQLARDINQKPDTVFHWKKRIPSDYWPEIVAKASEYGMDVTLDLLAKTNPRRGKVGRPPKGEE